MSFQNQGVSEQKWNRVKVHLHLGKANANFLTAQGEH